MRRDEARVAGNDVYIVWLEDRLSFLRLIVCALLAAAVIFSLALKKTPSEKGNMTDKAAAHSYVTPAPTPTPTKKPGENPLLKYLPKK